MAKGVIDIRIDHVKNLIINKVSDISLNHKKMAYMSNFIVD